MAGLTPVHLGNRPASQIDPEISYLFLDLSNIWCGLRSAAVALGEQQSAVRLHAGHLTALMADGRAVGGAWAVGRSDVPASVTRHFSAPWKFEGLEPGRETGTEQGVDQTLQGFIFSTIRTRRRGTIVLATGDGAGYHLGLGFQPYLEAAVDAGFSVELVSWRHSANRRMVAWVEDHGAVVFLDDHYRCVSFLDGWLRSPEPVQLRHRPRASRSYPLDKDAA